MWSLNTNVTAPAMKPHTGIAHTFPQIAPFGYPKNSRKVCTALLAAQVSAQVDQRHVKRLLVRPRRVRLRVPRRGFQHGQLPERQAQLPQHRLILPQPRGVSPVDRRLVCVLLPRRPQVIPAAQDNDQGDEEQGAGMPARPRTRASQRIAPKTIRKTVVSPAPHAHPMTPRTAALQAR